MTAKLSSKGQVVLPKQVRMRLQLRAGTQFACKVQGSSIVLTPQTITTEQPRLFSDPKTGLRITKSPREKQVTSEDVRAAMLDFP